MIKANELRIGNLLYWHCDNLCAGEGYVAEINEQGFRFVGNNGCHPHGDEYDEIKPIPLTPEWLLKFGFAESNSYNEKERHFRKDGFTQLADYGAQIIIVPEIGYSYISFGYYENQIDCPYVHQLQNLYFALTGEELIITELQP